MKPINPFVVMLLGGVLICNWLMFESQLGPPFAEPHRITNFGFQHYMTEGSRRGYDSAPGKALLAITYPGAVIGALFNNALLSNLD